MDDERKQFLIRHPDCIPQLLGSIVIEWNNCEQGVRSLLKELCSGGVLDVWRLADILVSEAGNVGLAQALNCYSDEFPDDHAELASSVAYISTSLERLRTYRNYYVHGITGATAFGFDMDTMLTSGLEMHELFEPGPFAHIYQKTAKKRSKFTWTFVRDTDLEDLIARLRSLREFIYATSSAVSRYLRGIDYDEVMLPKPPLPSVLAKPAATRQMLQQGPALVPRKRRKRNPPRKEG